MTPDFNPTEIERSAQKAWAQADVYRVTEDPSRPKFYACSMLPYPSGKLHMGHVRNYTINDMLTRHKRMKGFNVLMPMGWDAFGLPAENAAIKHKIPPAQWTQENIAYMKGQMQALGLAIDWSREIATCKPEYYRWNQWLFLKMLEAGIAERRTQVVNWDPVDHTVLANEQVIDGKGWRSGAPVEKREIPGYYLLISRYAQELLDHVQTELPGWPERVRVMQEHWIGKSEGVRFAFPHEIVDAQGRLVSEGRLHVFTTRADTLMGVTYCAVAPEHPLAQLAAQDSQEVADFIQECNTGGTTEAQRATQVKKGIFTGRYVRHPLTAEPVPVWVGNYVLFSYGDGAVMGVPAHDERDFAFAKRYGLPIKAVVEAPGHAPFDASVWHDFYSEKTHGTLIESGRYNRLNLPQAREAIASDLQAVGLGEIKTTWRLRDWGISRQRYWGTPIPIIHCDEHGAVPVPESDLPVILPEDVVPDGSGNPLTQHADFVHVPCPLCGRAARRETDTMDTFVDSSWYFMRYCDPHNTQTMVGQAAAYWLPMDQYIGGIEHAILHLLYARFWTKVMRDLDLLKIHEPFVHLLTQGMVLNEAFVRTNEGAGKDYFWAHDLDIVRDEHMAVLSATTKKEGLPVQYEGWTTMSKSKNNGVDPQTLIQQLGADTARLFVMFASPPEQTLEWNDAGVDGAHRFLRRVWAFAVANQSEIAGVLALGEGHLSFKTSKNIQRDFYTVLRQINFDYERMQFNTVISGCMKLMNLVEKLPQDSHRSSMACLGMSLLLRVLYPACPHMTWVLWAELGYAQRLGDLLDAPWPEVDESALVQDELSYMLQVNGKLRGELRVSATAERTAVEALALASPEFAKFSQGASVKKIIVVPGRLVNIVC